MIGIEILNRLGKTMVALNKVTDNVSVDMSHFPSGVYFMKVITSGGLKTLKFVKQ